MMGKKIGIMRRIVFLAVLLLPFTAAAGPAEEIGQADAYEALLAGISSEALDDGIILFDEIPALVERYSAVSRSMALSYDDQTRGVAEVIQAYKDEYDELWGDYQDQLDELEEEIHDADDAEEKAALRERRNDLKKERTGDERLKELRTQIKRYDDILDDADDGRKVMTTAKKQAIFTVQQDMYSYWEQVLALDKARQEYAFYVSAVDKARAQWAAGTVSELFVQRASMDLKSAEGRLSRAETDLDNTKRSIAVSLGWSSESYGNVEIGEVPIAEAGFLSGRDRNADLQSAMEYSRSYISAMRSNDRNYNYDDARTTRYEVEFEYADQQLRIVFDRLCDRIAQAEQEIAACETSRQLALKRRESAEAKKAAGTIDDSEYGRLQLEAIEKGNAYDLAVLSYNEAVLSYKWALKGLMDSR